MKWRKLAPFYVDGLLRYACRDLEKTQTVPAEFGDMNQADNYDSSNRDARVNELA